MLKGNILVDVKLLCARRGITQREAAEKAGTSPAYLSRMIRGRHTVVNPTFIRCMEALGYDVRLTYEKRTEEKQRPAQDHA